MKPRPHKLPLFVFLAASLEYYDFLLFPLLASVITQVFFANFPYKAWLDFVFFSLGAFAKFSGGVLLGFFADKYGRRYILNVVTSLMIIATLGFALFPTGINTIVSLFLMGLLRWTQGFSFGAEIPAASTYAFELAGEHKSKKISLVFTGATLGAIVATFLLTILTTSMSPSTLKTWGWRLPFVFGTVLGLFALWTRKHLCETLLDDQRLKSLELAKSVFKWRTLLRGLCVILWPATLVTLNLYFPKYLSSYYSVPLKSIYSAQTISLIFSCLFLISAGHLYSVYKIKTQLLAPLLVFICLSGSLMFEKVFMTHLTLFFIFWQFCVSFSMVFSMKQLLSLFESSSRTLGTGLVYNLGFLIASTLPVAFSKLYQSGYGRVSLWWLVAACGIIHAASQLKKKNF